MIDRTLLFSIGTILSLSSGLAPALAQSQKPEDSAPARLASLVPLNVAIRDFRLPQYNTEGQLTAVIEVGQLRRVSAQRFALEDVRIHLFESGREARIIKTPHARFHLEHQLMAGDHRVTVQQPGEAEPVATGYGFVYDLESHIWSLAREVTTRFRFQKPQTAEIQTDAHPSETP